MIKIFAAQPAEAVTERLPARFIATAATHT